MSRLISGCALATVLAASGVALADEPVRLDAAQLDLVTAAYMSEAGWQIGLFTGGQRTLFDPVLLQNGSDSEFQSVGGGANGASGDVSGTATTTDFGNGSVTITQFNGLIRTRGDGNGAVLPAANAQGDYTGTGSVIVPIANEDGSTSYIGTTWAYAYDNPFNNP